MSTSTRPLPQAFASNLLGWRIFHLELGGGIGGRSARVKLGFVPRLNLWWRF